MAGIVKNAPLFVSHAKNLKFWDRKKHWKENSVVFLTGAGSGIGMNLAYLYAERKCRLVLADVDKDSLVAVASKCESLGSQTLSIHLNVTKENDVKDAVQQCIDKYGELDVLVLCAGIAAHHVFQNTMDLSLFDKLMKVNFFGYLYCVKYAFEHLMASCGTLLAITSFSGEVGLPYRTAYCASKFAVTGFLEALRSEMDVLKKAGTTPFHITIVCPPTVSTNLRRNSLTPDPALKDSPHSKNTISVEQCARAILDAGDRRLRKAFFPIKSWLAAYIRPILPDLVDAPIRKRAMM